MICAYIDAKGVRGMAYAQTVIGKGKTGDVKGASSAMVPFYSTENAVHAETDIRQVGQSRKNPLPLKDMKSFRRAPQASGILKNEAR